MTGQADEGTWAQARLPPAQVAWMRALARQVRRPLVVATTLPVVGGVLLLPQAWALARALHMTAIDRQSLSFALPWIAMAAGLLVLRAALGWTAEHTAHQAAESAKKGVRVALFRRLLSAGVLWSRGRSSGELADALTARVEALDGYLARYLPALVSAAVLPLLYCAVLFGFDWIAALVLVLTVPAIPLFMALVGWGAEAAGRAHATALTRLSGLFADRVRGLTTLKLHGRAQAEAGRVARAGDEVRQRTMAVLRIAFLSSAVLEFFAALGVAGLAVYFGLTFLGLLGSRPDALTLETALFCLLMAPEVYWPWRQLAAHYHDRANARAAVGEIARLFDGLPEMDSAPIDPGADVIGSHPPGFELAALHMPVPGRDAIRLTPSTRIAPGDWIALQGPSGSGKSTLLETLAGLRPYEGTLCFAGMPVSQWPGAMLRQQVLLVPQRPWLSPGSLADNLRLARAEADDSALQQAMAAAGLAELLTRLPHGLSTPLGQRGLGLSGGQAQRLALARMFLSSAPVLLLDEPTAHLDDASRDQVLAQLVTFARGRTIVVATHDPVVAAIAPRCWTIDSHGEVHP
ncbi:thiol reductant ABC exporter subunit CydD [Lysobacter sp.]|uniref:thiol reductant ABC exporter subunit CydD n=1 Tax=Lysobacter sp. TaxID=72226 RepID=UPI002D5D649F|nr:thiol reductant ABC exporter subunit CydD [Lysobacter sp.]HZX77293.1 thiol reductant ABC exporter subunit CydD [Lysobacter sp.]